MTHELILTSVSQGLEPGSNGYCVVAENRGIPQQIRKRLESMSDYRHLDVEEPHLQPVVYSHLIFLALDLSWHLLSRIADAGTDYRHEPNQLAHHIALQNDETVDEGPAWLLALPEFHVTEWLTPSVRFNVGRSMPGLSAPPAMTRRQRIARERHWADHRKTAPIASTEEESPEFLRARILENEEQILITKPPSSPCPTWQELTGDAGWGGILAETARTGQPALLLFPPGMNLLPLYLEAIALLPDSYRWKATFTTCYTHLPDHVACQWKGVPAGSREAEALSAERDLLILDLSRPMGAAPAGPYVEFARQGRDDLLPDDESRETLFHAAADSETKPYDFEDVPDRIVLETGAATDAAFADGEADWNEAETPTGTAIPGIPPVLPSKVVSIRARKTSKPAGFFGKLLNMKSKEQFYILYGVTLLLVMFLLALVADQLVDFGLIRWMRGERTAMVQPGGEDPVQGGEPVVPVEDLREKERLRIEQAEQRRQKAAQARLELKRKKADVHRREFERRRQKDIADLRDTLADLPLPDTLDVPIPPVQGTEARFPEPKLFEELSGLFSYGAGLELEWVPLVSSPSLRTVTRKLEPRRLPLPEDASLETTDADPAAIPDDPADLIAGEPDIVPIEDDTWVPDTSRFEWTVATIDRNTLQETPLFDLLLTEEGLRVAWRREGFTPALYHSTLQSTLGFLRISAMDEPLLSNRREIPLFPPTVLETLSVNSVFGDPSAASTWTVATPFAEEPWRDLFTNTVFPFVLRLEVVVTPEKPTGIPEIQRPELESPSRVLLHFVTDVSSRKPIVRGNETVPITVSLEGKVDPVQVAWTDLFDTQQKELKEAIEADDAKQKELEVKVAELNQKAFNAGPEGTELRKERNTVNEELQELKRQKQEYINRLERLPSAHHRFVGNKDLKIDFAVFLDPISGNAAPAAVVPAPATVPVPFGVPAPVNRSEKKSLLIMKTEGFEIAEKADFELPDNGVKMLEFETDPPKKPSLLDEQDPADEPDPLGEPAPMDEPAPAEKAGKTDAPRGGLAADAEGDAEDDAGDELPDLFQ